MLIYAHRGLHDAAPENTMAAFLRAEMSGVDGIETDLRTTADRKVVLYHDRTFGGCAVEDHTYEELRIATGIDVPLLDHVLERTWRIGWNFEIKTRAAAALCVDRLRAGAPKGTIVSSFDHHVVEEVVEATGLEGALLLASLQSDRHDFPLPTDGISTLVWDWNVVRPDGLARAEQAGWASMIYGPVTPEEHEALAMLRPRAVITDHPHLVAGPMHGARP